MAEWGPDKKLAAKLSAEFLRALVDNMPEMARALKDRRTPVGMIGEVKFTWKGEELRAEFSHRVKLPTPPPTQIRVMMIGEQLGLFALDYATAESSTSPTTSSASPTASDEPAAPSESSTRRSSKGARGRKRSRNATAKE
jgi:hypothetical protein